MSHYTITAHMVVKNEANWIWYAIMSVIDHVDRMIIYDTGSSDNTAEIIESIAHDPRYQDKIEYEEKGPVTIHELAQVRQEQINKTTTDYFFVVDGDEIWYPKVLRAIQEQLDNAPQPIGLLWTRMCIPGGDIYHYRDDSREHYTMSLRDAAGNLEKQVVGSYSIRFYSMKIPGIHCVGDYGVEGFFDANGVSVQDGPYHAVLSPGYYFHTSFLQRAGHIKGDHEIPYRKRKDKAWDGRFPRNFSYPPILYQGDKAALPIYNPWTDRVSLSRQLIHHLKRIARYILHR